MLYPPELRGRGRKSPYHMLFPISNLIFPLEDRLDGADSLGNFNRGEEGWTESHPVGRLLRGLCFAVYDGKKTIKMLELALTDRYLTSLHLHGPRCGV